MAGTLPAGPFGSLRLGGRDAPFYVIPFDKDGALQAPATATRLVSDVAASVGAGDPGPAVTDVIIVVHGWNTDFTGALALARDLVGQLDGTITAQGAPRAEFRPLILSVFWPSIVLSGSTAPAMAAAPLGDVDLEALSVLAQEVVAPERRGEFYELVQAGDLDRDAALRLAELLAPLYAGADDDLPGAGGSDADGTVATWIRAQSRLAEAEGPVVVSGPTGPRLPEGGAAAPVAGPQVGPQVGGPAGPQAAGLFDILDPRNVVRLATVLLMKDRAGVVGFRGVGPLLARILGARADVRVHLVGHSYGCKASLSAVSSDLPRSVRSLLLLQPALSFLALSDDVPQLGKPGGYAGTKQRTELPILATWSRRDVPLHTLFALAVRRQEDLGEQNIGAAGRENPPSLFAAMGGWGPQAAPDVTDVDILRPGDAARYPLHGGGKVLAVDGTAAISGHSDVTNAATAWALYTLIAG
jgi:hypothetical protein